MQLFFAHSLLGDQQDEGTQSQNGTSAVEDGRTDTTSGRKLGTGLVVDLGNNSGVG